jgi:hypothetical protein
MRIRFAVIGERADVHPVAFSDRGEFDGKINYGPGHAAGQTPGDAVIVQRGVVRGTA